MTALALAPRDSHRLRLGDLILSDGTDDDPNGTDWRMTVLGEDFSTGDPLSVQTVVRTLLQDGSIVEHDRDDNREPGLTVVIDAPTSASLAEGTAALIAQLYRRNELGWTPSDGWSVETVYDVTDSFLTRVSTVDGLDSDLAEVRATSRSYRLNITAQPFGRGNDPIVSVALPPPAQPMPTFTTIDNADSTTLWSAVYGTLVDKGSYLSEQKSKTPNVNFTPASAVDLTGTPFLSLRMWNPGVSNGLFASTPVLMVDGVQASLAAQVAEAGYTRFFWRTAATSFRRLNLSSTLSAYLPQAMNFTILQKSDGLPSLGTQRESLRALAVRGTARTQGSFVISHPSAGLGTTMLYTCSNADVNYSPSLRQFRSGGGTVTGDSSRISGSSEPMASFPTFDVPVSRIVNGKHQLVVYVKRTSAGSTTLYANSQVFSAAGVAIGSLQTISLPVVFADTNWFAVAIGNLALPLTDLPDNSSAIVRITLGSNGDTAVMVDQAWIFNLDDGNLTWVEAGARKMVTIDTASVDRPYPAVFVGDAVDGSDSYNALNVTQSMDDHMFRPPQVVVFVVTSGPSTLAAATFTYYLRSHYELGDQ